MVGADTVALQKKGKKPLGTVKIEGQLIREIWRKQKTWERKNCSFGARWETDLLEKQNEVEEYIRQIGEE